MSVSQLPLITLAEHYFKTGNHKLAKKILDEIITISPKNSKANELLSYIFSNQGESNLSFKFLKIACEDPECSYEALYYLGTMYLKYNFYELAVMCFQKSINKVGNYFEALHDMGTAYGQMEKIDEALTCFQKCLKINENSYGLYFNIARCLDKRELFNEALTYYDRAIELKPDFVDALINKGVTLNDLRRYEEALILFTRAIELKPEFPEAWSNKGMTLNDLKQYEDALVHCDRAIELKPDYAEAWCNKGITLNNLRCYEEALIHFDRAIELKTDIIEGWCNKGITLNNLRCYEEALIHFDRAIELKPNFAKSWCNKGVTLNDLKRYDEALTHYDRAIELQKDYPEAWCNKGVTLNNLKRYDEALAHFDRAIELKPDYAEVWCNKGVTLNDLRRSKEALVHYDRAIELKPDYAEAQFNRAVLNLHLKNLSDGWREYEARSQTKEGFKNQLPLSIELVPIWDGKRSCDHILVKHEQGIGDEIFYISFLNQLQTKVKKISVIVDKRLISVFSRSFPQVAFLDEDDDLSKDLYDAQVLLASLPLLFNIDLSEEPTTRCPYLIDNINLSSKLKELPLFKDKFTCGISWKSSNNKLGSSKSIALENLKNILHVPNCEFINLQYGDTVEEVSDAEKKASIKLNKVDDIDVFSNIDGLLSIIKSCDIIITVSNVTAHLAGAIGKKTLLLLPYAHGRIWYWHDEKNSSWYPSIEQFYQSADFTWDSAIEEIAEKVRNEIDRKN